MKDNVYYFISNRIEQLLYSKSEQEAALFKIRHLINSLELTSNKEAEKHKDNYKEEIVKLRSSLKDLRLIRDKQQEVIELTDRLIEKFTTEREELS